MFIKNIFSSFHQNWEKFLENFFEVQFFLPNFIENSSKMEFWGEENLN